MVILEENFKWHLEAFASELFICSIKIGKTWIRLAWWIRCYLTSPLTKKPSLWGNACGHQQKRQHFGSTPTSVPAYIAVG